ncbi:metacaspase-1 [Prunus yedoensis var. nudiflora]|uniref:Metacaspase-1 n=1 Tax=Prunus yedoensis var. nudiflora TaxID=2094558 RepID=A0A314UW49_PRUYE|nr:metacaspase-1 [Prunus yedoensis var. nudiflora]
MITTSSLPLPSDSLTMLMPVQCSKCHKNVQLLQPGPPSMCCHVATYTAPSSYSHHNPPHQLPLTALPPPPYSHLPPRPPLFARVCKRAVICAVSYKNSKHELKGCINDANCMRYLLVNRFHFPESSILMLTEEEADPNRHPSKQNMIKALYWLVQDCQPGDSLVFHYSGHGKRKKNSTGDEVDGYDEYLCPLDFKTGELISDDEINAIIVRRLPHGVKLHAFIDACHSGTALDLPFLCRMDRSRRYLWEDHRPSSGVWKGTNGGKAICFSGCDDHQTSADASALSNTTPTGAMTFSFIQAIEHGHGTTYGDILSSMQYTIRNAENEDCDTGTSPLLNMTRRGSFAAGFTQEPQLTASEKIKLKKPFSL